MAPIKLFRAVRKYFKAMGFYAPPSPIQNCELNRKNMFYTFAMAGMFILVTGFFLFKATTIYEYSMSFYMSIAMITVPAYCVIFIYKMGSIEMLIEKYEEFIGKRKHI